MNRVNMLIMSKWHHLVNSQQNSLSSYYRNNEVIEESVNINLCFVTSITVRAAVTSNEINTWPIRIESATV